MSGISNLTSTIIQGNLPSAKISAGDMILQQGNITRTPQALTQLAQSMTLKGEVQGQNADGTTRIQTPRGHIDIKLDTALPKGQRVDIQIESGTPPRQAIVQTTALKTPPSPPQGQSTHPAPAPTTTPQNGQQTVQQPARPIPSPTQPAQPSPTVQQGSAPPPDPTMDSVKSLQHTAQQATQKMADAAKQSLDPTQIIQGQQPPSQRALQTGQAVRLTPLPPNLQNPNGLNAMPQAQTPLPQMNTSLPSVALTPTLPQISANTAAPISATPISPQVLLQNLLSLSSTGQGQWAMLASGKADNTIQIMVQSLLSLPSSSHIGKALTMPVSPNGTGISHPLNIGASAMQDAKISAVAPPVINGTTSSMTITNIVSPASPLQNLQAGQILATATGHVTPGGNPIVQIPVFGQSQPLLFALNYPATSLPKGTQIIMQPALPANTAPAMQPSTATSWSVMEDAFELLLSQLTGAQAQSLANIFPRPAPTGHQFTAAALLFIAAARGGDIAGWMGNRADQILRNVSTGGKRDMIDRLLREVSTSTGRAASADPNAPAATQGSSDWRGYTLPMLFGMDIEKMHLWAKPFGDDDNDGQNADKAKGTRFIVEVTLSRMGNVQLDGLVQPYAKRLDLVLRTEHDFSPDVRQHLRQVWHNALTHIDMGGNLDFTQIS